MISLMKEIEEDFRRLKDSPCACIGRIKTVEMTILPKPMHRLNKIPIKIPEQFFKDIKRTILNFMGTNEKSRIAEIIL